MTIIAFLMSFLFGGIGMYFSAQVNARWKAGNVAGAQKASKTALILGIIGIAAGAIIVIAAVSSSSSSPSSGY